MNSAYYCIRVKGHLQSEWSEWFDNMVITHEPDGNSALSGAVRDQPALYGLLLKLANLGLTLISVAALGSDHDIEKGREP